MARFRFVLLVVVGALMALPAAAQSVTLSFEGGTSSGSVPGATNPEGWDALGGLAQVLPDANVTGPAAGFPTDGGQWALVSSAGAISSLTVPPGGPAPFPLAPGETGNLRVPLTLPATTLPITLSFDWTWLTRECQNASTFNDFFSVDITDGAGTVLQNLLYRDTYSADLLPGGLTPGPAGSVPGGLCAGPFETGPLGTAKTTSVTLSPALAGASNLWLEFNVGNGGDSSYDGHAWIDRIEIDATPATYPGSGLDLVLRTGVNGPANGEDRKAVAAGDAVQYVVTSPQASFVGDPLVLLLTAFPTGAYPGATPGLPDVAVNLFNNQFFYAGLPTAPLGTPVLPAAGYTLSDQGYAGLEGLSFLFQGAVLSASAPAGYATTDAHELYYPSPIYVSSSTGLAGNPGTAAAPLSSLSAAYALARTQGAAEIRLAAGTYVEIDLVCDEPIDLRGGYDAVTWAVQPGTRSLIATSHRGLRFVGIDAITNVERLEVQAVNAPAPAAQGPFDMDMASVALDVRGCTDALRFTDCLFQSARGADGRAGASATTPGGDGTAGNSGSSGYLVYTSNNSPSGGSGGGGARSGGAGGKGGWVTCNSGWLGPCTTGTPRRGNDGGDGSGSGDNGGPGGNGATCNSAADGTDGGDGTPGSHGANGLPAPSPGGVVSASGDWSPGFASDGADGGNGGGGGGGGGGGCGSCLQQFVVGASGGGGGGGAYGGDHGSGGIDGGGSFAVWLFDASPLFQACTFVAGQGGTGGAGGNGSDGGVGGPGAGGGSGVNVTVAGVGLGSGDGGIGGTGGDGGGGGGGGGGHGGPSWCVFRAGVSNPVGLTATSQTFVAGQGGFPGLGGAQGNTGSLAPSGQAGPVGTIGN